MDEGGEKAEEDALNLTVDCTLHAQWMLPTKRTTSVTSRLQCLRRVQERVANLYLLLPISPFSAAYRRLWSEQHPIARPAAPAAAGSVVASGARTP
jgi:hypothetical protein